MPVRVVTRQLCDVCYADGEEVAATARLRFGWQRGSYVLLACDNHETEIRPKLGELARVATRQDPPRAAGRTRAPHRGASSRARTGADGVPAENELGSDASVHANGRRAKHGAKPRQARAASSGQASSSRRRRAPSAYAELSSEERARLRAWSGQRAGAIGAARIAAWVAEGRP